MSLLCLAFHLAAGILLFLAFRDLRLTEFRRYGIVAVKSLLEVLAVLGSVKGSNLSLQLCQFFANFCNFAHSVKI